MAHPYTHVRDVVKENSAFVEYYLSQKIVRQEEVEEFLSVCRRPLSEAFRFNEMNPAAKHFKRELIQGKFAELQVEDPPVDKEVSISGVERVPWYFGENAWRIGVTRSQLKKTPELKPLREYLMMLDSDGVINRQELVSMIPPIVLQVEPGHVVLDMCASPGSKTAQLIDAIHSDKSVFPSGLIIANDASSQRAQLLVHQLQRLSSPCFVATNHEGQQFPKNEIPGGFDRILADVPCSGDGTLRKNLDIWRKWKISNVLALHALQVSIAWRGFELLKDDGMMVYSTCALNPLEDEAVVAELIRRSNGALSLLDARHLLPGLKSSKGLTSWAVPVGGEMMTIYDAEKIKAAESKQVKVSMFPPSEQEAQSMHLERCIRVLPHHQDTGGFFIALLKKNSVEKLESSVEVIHSNELSNQHSPGPQKKKMKRFVQPKYDDPFLELSTLENGVDRINSIRKFFALPSDFPLQNVFTRSEGKGKRQRMYLVSDQAASVLKSASRLMIVHAGIRCFEQGVNDEEHVFDVRVYQDVFPVIQPFVSKQTLSLELDKFSRFVSEGVIRRKKEEWDAAVLTKINQLERGSVLVVLDEADCTRLEVAHVGVASWLTNVSLSMMVKKDSSTSILRLLEAARRILK